MGLHQPTVGLLYMLLHVTTCYYTTVYVTIYIYVTVCICMLLNMYIICVYYMNPYEPTSRFEDDSG